jgi:hypothetical protein
MSTQYDNFVAVAAAWELNERLVYHTQPGRMLAGLNYDSEGTLKVDGHDDLPLLQPWTVQIEEGIAPGAPKAAHAGVTRKNTPVAETMTLVFRFGTSRRDGWFRRDPTLTSARKGFMEWLALVRDAIETDTQGDADAALNIGALRPVRFSVRENETTQLAFYCYLEVELLVQHYCRTERASTLPE